MLPGTPWYISVNTVIQMHRVKIRYYHYLHFQGLVRGWAKIAHLIFIYSVFSAEI
jgi:hypothetical protein